MELEGNLSSGNMISASVRIPYDGFDLQGSMSVHHQNLTIHQQNQHPQPSRQQGSMVHHPSIHENFPLSIGTMRDRANHYDEDEDDRSLTEDAHDNHNDGNKGKKMSHWQRVKWSDPMVRLLVNAVSYIGEDAAMEFGGGGRRKCSNLQKKGKWKSVSKAMAERGHFVSPQQCEDKFNDLNKRYKRLNEILGRGTSCEVVENPALLDLMDHVSDKAKEEVKKILSSKHLYYEEMCSYHNGNRLHLPPDPELQRSLRLALKARDDHDNNDDDDDQDHDMDDHNDYEENHHNHLDRRGVYASGEGSAKRMKQFEGDVHALSCGKTVDCNKNFGSEPNKANLLQEQWMKNRMVQLEEQKVHIQAQMLELENERFKWQRFCRKKDQELEMMRMENERMKLENEQMALELKRKEICADY